MEQPKRIGLIGLDTSHVSVFTALLNDPTHQHHVAGARVTVAYPGGSPDFPLSRDRVAGFTKELAEQWKVAIVDSPEAVAEACDIVFIETVDGRVHLEQFRRIVSFGKPTFIDKPFATRLDDAREIIRLAEKAGVALMSCSPLRFAQSLTDALKDGRQGILGCDVVGPMDEEPTQPGLFWYGIHTVEMLVTAMGTGCREVRCVRNDGHDLLTAIWSDGRVGSIHGLRGGHRQFGLTLHRKDRLECLDASAGKPYYAAVVGAIMASLPLNQSPIPHDEMLHVIQIIEAANASRAANGQRVSVSEK